MRTTIYLMYDHIIWPGNTFLTFYFQIFVHLSHKLKLLYYTQYYDQVFKFEKQM